MGGLNIKDHDTPQSTCDQWCSWCLNKIFKLEKLHMKLRDANVAPFVCYPSVNHLWNSGLNNDTFVCMKNRGMDARRILLLRLQNQNNPKNHHLLRLGAPTSVHQHLISVSFEKEGLTRE